MNDWFAATEWLKSEPLHWRLRTCPRALRDRITEGFVLHRGRLHDEPLKQRIIQHCLEADVLASSKGEVKAIPPWMISVVLNLMVKLMMALLERWWKRQEMETISHA